MSNEEYVKCREITPRNRFARTGEEVRTDMATKYADAPGRYKTRADRYLVVVTPNTPADAVEEYAQDHPEFTGSVVMLGKAVTKPSIGIDRKVIKEYLFDVHAGRSTRRTKQHA